MHCNGKSRWAKTSHFSFSISHSSFVISGEDVRRVSCCFVDHVFGFVTDYILPILLFLLAVAGGAVVFALWRHKQSGMGQVELVGVKALVQTELTPEGAVLVKGELWPARSFDGTSIAANERVEVAGIEGHLLLVKRYT